MKLALTTLGCPSWPLNTLLTNALAYGYDGIDFRGLQGQLDITALPAFTSDLPQTVRRIQSSGVAISGISSSICICNPDLHSRNLDEARRTIPLALALGAKNIRVMGYGPIDTTSKPDLAKIGRDMMLEILALPDADQLSWNFETHDHWIKGADAKLILDALPHPNFNAIWDLGAYMATNETPAQTYAALSPRIRYIHIKDALYDPNHPHAMKGEFGVGTGWRYVFPGTGQLPLAHCLQILQQNHYQGWLLYEFEKHWHPELPDPELALPAFIQWIRPLITP